MRAVKSFQRSKGQTTSTNKRTSRYVFFSPLFLFFPLVSRKLSVPFISLSGWKHVHVLCGTLSAAPRTLPWKNDLDDNFILCYRGARGDHFGYVPQTFSTELIYIGTLAFALHVLINGLGESIFDQTILGGAKYVPGEAKRDLLGFPKVESYLGSHESF